MNALTEAPAPKTINGIFFGAESLRIISIIYLLGFSFSEFLYHYVSTISSIFFYFIILFSLVIFSSKSFDEKERALWLALGLIPIIRIVSIATPIMVQISQVIWYVVISIPILVGIIAVMRSLKYNLNDVGFVLNKPFIQLLTGLSGICFSIIAYYILKPIPWYDRLSVQTALFPALILIIFTGVFEELIFRGILQRAASILGSFGWIFIACAYTVTLIGQQSILYCSFIFIVNLFFGYIVKRTGSIFGVSLAHGCINIGLFLFLPHLL